MHFSAPLAAVGTFNGSIIPTSVQTCAAGWAGLVQVIGTLLQFAIYLGVIICVLTIAYAGFLWVLNPLSPENRSSAKNVLQNSVIGLLLILCSWLIVNTILSAISTGGISVQTAVFGTGGDTCIQAIAQSTISSGGNPGSPGAPGSGGGQPSPTSTPPTQPVPPSGNTNQDICNAANAYRGTSTAAGPDGGNLACGWAVNNVLTNAGVSSLGSNPNYVPTVKSALDNGRGTAISASDAQCGDIVVQGDQGHIGICMNAGCSQVLSNSSSKASFTNTRQFTGYIYRVNGGTTGT